LARVFAATAFGLALLLRDEPSAATSSSLLAALRFDPAFRDDEPVVELSPSAVSDIVEMDSRFSED